MNERRFVGQSLIELLILLLPVVLSFVFARIFFRYIGWWGVLPGVILGFGWVGLLFYLLLNHAPRAKAQNGQGQ